MKKHPLLIGILLGSVAIAAVLLRQNLSSMARPPRGGRNSGISPRNTPPSDEEVAKLARQHWEEEGRPEGRALEHWHRAEHELREELLEQLAEHGAPSMGPMT